MSTNNGRWDDMPENLLRLPGPDAVLPDRMLAGILCGRPVRVGAPPEALALGDLVAALRLPARSDEPPGEGAALAAYRQAMSTDDLEEQVSRTLRPSLGAKIAAAALVGSLGMGGVAAAAAGGSLPAPLQDLAHVLFGAPPAPSNGHDGGDGTGGVAPVPVPTDESTQPLYPEQSSDIPATGVPTDLATSEQCPPEAAVAESCDDVAETGREPDTITEPSPTPTTSASGTDATESDGSENPEGSPEPTGGDPEGLPPGGPPPWSQWADSPSAPPGGPPPWSRATGRPSEPLVPPAAPGG